MAAPSDSDGSTELPDFIPEAEPVPVNSTVTTGKRLTMEEYFQEPDDANACDGEGSVFVKREEL